MTEEENIQNADSKPTHADGSAKPVKTKSRPWWKRILRLFLWTGSIFIFLLLALVGLTYIYQDEVKGYVIDEVNKRVISPILVKPEDIDITIVKTFPDVSVIFNNIAALDATASEKRDTLLKAESISLGFNIMDLFHGNYSIHNIEMENGQINVRVDENGKDNYHFLKETDTTSQADTSHVDFELDKISLRNVVCSYADKKSDAVYKAEFHNLNFTGDFGKDKYDFGTEADFTVEKIMFGKSTYFKNNSGSIDLVIAIDNLTGNYQVSRGKLKIAELALDVTGNFAERNKNYLLDLLVKGDDIDLAAALSLLPSSYTSNIAGLKSTGEFFIDGTIKGLMGDSATPDIITKFGITDGTLGRNKSTVELHSISMEGIFSNVKGNDGIQITSFKASSEKSKFTGSFLMKNFDRPKYSTKLSGHIDMEELQQVLAIDTIESASGMLDVAFEASGSPAKGNSLTAKDFRTFKTSGSVTFTNGAFKLKGQTFPVDSIGGKLVFDGNNVGAENFKARAGNSDISMDAQVRNLLGYIFTEKEVLDINGKVSCDNLDLNALLNSEKAQTEKSADTTYHLVMPDRLRLNLNTAVNHVVFRKFEASEVRGMIRLSNERLTADPVSFRSMDGSFTGSGMIDGTQGDSLLITCSADITSVNIYKLFYQMENFGQEDDTTITCNNVRGNLTSHVNFASLWGNDLNVNEKKIYTDAEVTITNGELINFKPLEALSRFIKLEELKDIKFKSLHNTIEIKNRVISMPKMDIHSSAIDITMYGKHDFDNMVDYHFIVDLDELRSKKVKAAKPENSEFGHEIEDGGHRTRLFISMKGDIDDPQMSYDKNEAVKTVVQDLKQEGKNLKQMLHEEWGLFKNDKDKEDRKDRKKEDEGKFILQQDDNPKPKDKKKKGDENLDDGDDYK
ncbi:MAG: hypothetical protein M3R17_05225 [Bacteroidota bacterium]|nr:hypothetical protein [Bacteroidota bacterium]